jgi:arylsulfatase
MRLLLSLLILAVQPHIASALRADTRLPNIVIIFMDDMGYGDAGCYGAKGWKTPNIDRLAKQGTRYTAFHVSQPVCSASRASLLTGCYANRLGIHGALGPNARHGLADREVTLAEMLKSKGYATGMAGKWHLGHHPQFLPTRHGFDEYYGLPYSNDMWPLHPGAAAGYPPLPLIEGEKPVKEGMTGEDQSHLTEDYTRRAVQFIERNHRRPFFFYLAHTMPHVPLYPGSRFKGSSSGVYGDVIQELDWSVGEVMAALKRYHLEKDTLLVFTSDNGPWLSYGAHAGSSGGLREGKGTSWEGGTRVPCILRWPGRIPADTVSTAFWMSIDLFPTIAGLVDAALPPHPIDGKDVWPLISGKRGARNPHTAYFSYYETNQLQAVFSGDGRWKLVLPHTYRTLAGKRGGENGRPAAYTQVVVTKPELYDLRNDIGETTDLSSKEPGVLAEMLQHAEAARSELGDSLTKREGAGVRPAAQVGSPSY